MRPQETVEQFLARGGKIKVIKPRDDRFASHTSRYHFKDLPDYQDPVATAPGGRIEPGPRNKTWSNQKKTRALQPTR